VDPNDVDEEDEREEVVRKAPYSAPTVEQDAPARQPLSSSKSIW